MPWRECSKVDERMHRPHRSPPMPESLEETWIDYESGLAADTGCAEDVIPVALPQGTELDSAHGCGGLHRFARRIADWWRSL